MSKECRILRAGFTLLELLVVIAIIGILAAILLTGVQAVQEGARRKRAAVEVRRLADAVRAYRQEYGKLPLQTSSPPDETKKVDKELIEVLTATEEERPPKENPRRIVFLQLRPGDLDRDSSSDTYDEYPDPWHRPYIIAMDTDGDGEVIIDPTKVGRSGSKKHTLENRIVAVMSAGRNPAGGTQEVYSWDF